MKSHEFAFKPRDLAPALLPTLLAVVGLVTLLKAGNWLGLLPPPAIWVDPDRTMLEHQSQASRARDPASVLLVGDSTCLAGVDASALSPALPGRPRVLNLALIIGLGLDVYGEVAADFAAANPGQVRAVILLASPAKLSDPRPSEGQMEVWREIHHPTAQGARDILGLDLLRRRILGYALDTPLQGSGADYYGFSSEIDAYMTAHNGSLVDFGRFKPLRGEPAADWQWRPSPELASQARAFRARIPAGVKLILGLTPGPASTVTPGDARRGAELLRQWDRWIGADALLTNLPPSLPDAFFSRTAHLNRQGQRVFTVMLGRELAAALENPVRQKVQDPNP